MARRNLLAIRVSDEELAHVRSMSKDWGVSQSEVWRRLLLTVRVLFSTELMLSDVLKINDRTFGIQQLLARGHDLPMHVAMRSIPELIRILEAKETMRSIEKTKLKKGIRI